MSDFQEFKERVRQETDLVELVAEHVPSLKRAGANYTGLCPFHEEKTPSFSVNPTGQFFHCFGCGAGGDAFTFISRVHSLEFFEALKYLAERRGIPVPQFRGGDPQAREGRPDQRQTLLALHELAQKFFRRQLAGNAAACEYCRQRGISSRSQEIFGIGCAPLEDWAALTELARKQRFSEETLLASGLALRGERTQKLYDRFRKRLMFPIQDIQGRVIAFGGRILEKDEQSAKYINSPETPIYTKGRWLYGVHQAQKSIRAQNAALLCEGNIDLIMLHQHGFENSVATLGTALTREQGKLLRRMCERVFLLYDGDEAGQKAMLRATEIFLPLGLQVRVVAFDAADDPDTFLRREGAAGLTARLERAPDYLDFFLMSGAKKFDPRGAQGKAALLEFMAPLLAKIENPILAQDARKRLAEFLRLEEAIALEALAKARAPKTAQKPATTKPRAEDEPPPCEAELLRQMAYNETVRREMRHRLNSEWIGHELTRYWIEEIIHREEQGVFCDLKALVSLALPSSEQKKINFLQKVLIENPGPIKDIALFTDETLKKLRLNSKRRDAQALRERLQAAERCDPNDCIELSYEYLSNWRQKQELIQQCYHSAPETQKNNTVPTNH